MNFKNSVLARAPTRICDIGGWTDTWFYPKGAVFNFCVDLYSYVRIVQTQNDYIKIFAEDLGQQIILNKINKINYDGNLDLLKAAVKWMNIENGLNIYVKADAPPGCGTGTSASVAVSLLAALARLLEKKMSQKEIAKIAHELEIKELNLESGVQDQYAVALGGINFMEIAYPTVVIEPIQISPKKVCELESQLILVFLSSRSSSEMHKAVINNYKKGDKITLKSLEIIKNCAYEMKNAILSEDLAYMGDVMNKNWDSQKNLHSLMVNPIIKKVEKIAMNNGAVGFKINGAGGGGSASIIADIGKENLLKRQLIKSGFRLLSTKLDFLGVQTWKT